MSSNEQKRSAIASAAMELFASYGFKSVSMDNIAERACVAKGTLYLYFKDKEALFYHLLDQFLADFGRQIQEIEARHLSLVDELMEVIYRVLLYRKNQKFLYMIFKEARELKTSIAVGGVRKIDDQIAGYLNRKLGAVFSGSNLNTELITFVIIKSYSALAFEWEETHPPLNEREISQAVGTILHGLFTMNGCTAQ